MFGGPPISIDIMSLKIQLEIQKRTRWLDIGSNKNFESGFYYMDIFPKNKIPFEAQKRYFKVNILKANKKLIQRLGKFDVVRMQHFLEHFGFEDGIRALKNASFLLKKDGLLILTVPDLKKNVNQYLTGRYKHWKDFKRWALKRIPKDAPVSFYFSIFSHSLPVTRHLWCYDLEGLKYILNLTKRFSKIQYLDLNDKRASIPFTHNRPQEDLCIIAYRK